MRDRFIQLADYTQLPAGAAAAPYFLFLDDGYEHGTYGQRDSGFDVYSSTGSAGPPAASGTLLNGAHGEDMSVLAVGDVVYLRSGQNANGGGNRKNLWVSRSITAVDATKATMHSALDVSETTRLFYRKLQAAAAASAKWIGVQDCQEVVLDVYVHSAATPVDVTIQRTAPGDTQTPVAISYTALTIAAGAGQTYRIQGPAGRLRVGFQGPDPSIVTARLLMRRGL